MLHNKTISHVIAGICQYYGIHHKYNILEGYTLKSWWWTLSGRGNWVVGWWLWSQGSLILSIILQHYLLCSLWLFFLLPSLPLFFLPLFFFLFSFFFPFFLLILFFLYSTLPSPLCPGAGNLLTFCLHEFACSRYFVQVESYNMWPFVSGLLHLA